MGSVARVFGVGLIAGLASVVISCGSRTDIENFSSTVGPPCENNSDCVVVPASCCGNCGAATRSDMKVVNRTQTTQGTPDRCATVTCGCYTKDPDPTLVATCSRGYCRILDLKKHPSTACTWSGDCFLRTSHCCGCGLPSDLVALRNGEGPTIDELVCDYGSLSCDGSCTPSWPPGATAICAASGHCELSMSPTFN